MGRRAHPACVARGARSQERPCIGLRVLLNDKGFRRWKKRLFYEKKSPLSGEGRQGCQRRSAQRRECGCARGTSEYSERYIRISYRSF